MSGGYFNYDQYKIMQIADSIEKVILNNQCEEITEYGDKVGKFYSQKLLPNLKMG